MLVSERCFNKLVPPVPNVRRGKIALPYRHSEICEIHNYWNEKNFMISDVVIHLIAENNADRGTLPKTKEDINIESYKSKGTLEYLQLSMNNGSTRNKKSNWITEGHLKIKFPFLTKYGSNVLYKIILETSKCIFKLSYNAKVYDDQKDKFYFSPINVNDSIFSFECKPVRETASGKILEREYQFDISNSMLGYLMFRNIAFVNYDWIPEELYNLSRNSQNFFRKFISHKKGMSKSIKIPLTNIKAFQLHNYKDYGQVKSITNKSLEELKKANLIKDYKVTGTRFWFTHYNIKI